MYVYVYLCVCVSFCVCVCLFVSVCVCVCASLRARHADGAPTHCTPTLAKNNVIYMYTMCVFLRSRARVRV